jgi:general secretion pathway protein M
MSLANRLADLLADRSPRERGLLTLLIAVAIPAAVVGLGLVPLSERRIAAETALAEAVALNGWVAARAAEAVALVPSVEGAAAAGPGAAIGVGALEEGLVTAGLRRSVTRLQTGGDGTIALEFDAVDFIGLMHWLDSPAGPPEAQIDSLQILAAEAPGRVAVRLGLKPGPAATP